MNLGYVPIVRVNFCRRTDFHEMSGTTYVDFFLGFNF
jgi:hypothetical protein